MRLPAYPEYRDSEVEWLGSLPSGWQVLRLKDVIACHITDGPHLTPEFQNEGVPFLSVDGIQNGELQFEGCRFVSNDDHVLFSQKVAPKRDDILLGKAASTGKIARVKVDFEFSIWSPLALIRPDTNQIEATYLEYALKSPITQAQIDVLCTHNTQSNISMDDIPRLTFPVPAIPEQLKIAAFLDWKTSQIDALIAKKQTLLQKLKEKRLAVITQAVTKGLNPDAPMRDSRIAWLGEVPAHWKLPALALRYKVELGKMLDEKQITKRHLIPYLRNVDVQWGKINFEDLPEMDIAPHEYSRYAIEEGDVLVCEGGEVGRAAIVGSQTSVFGFQKALHRLRAPTAEESPQFIFYTMMWAANTGVFNEEGNSTIAHLTAEKLRRYRFPQPPLAEQAAIVEQLGIATEQIRRLLDKAESAITRLTEYRSALITAATTGKIDVRGWKNPAM